MDEDLSVRAMKVQDQSEYQLDGSTMKVKLYRFYLGTHGPMTERFPADAPQPSSINQRIEQLRTEIRGIVA
jgi:hypothetical protein